MLCVAWVKRLSGFAYFAGAVPVTLCLCFGGVVNCVVRVDFSGPLAGEGVVRLTQGRGDVVRGGKDGCGGEEDGKEGYG